MSVEELMQAFGSGFGRVNPLAVILAGAAVIGFMAWFVVAEILRQSRRRREEVQIGWKYFAEYASHRRLTPAEIELLKEVVRAGEVASADMVFDSPFIFEDALEAYLEDEKARLEKDSSLYGLLRGLRYKLGFAQLPAETPLTSTRQFEEGLPVQWHLEGRTLAGTLQSVSERHWQIGMAEEFPQEIAPHGTLEVGLLRPGDAEYRVRTTLVSLRPGSRTLVLSHSRDLERKQLRNWVRVEVNLPCRMTVISGPDPASGERLLPSGLVVEGRLADLSGGGTCARLPSPVPRGHRVHVNFDLPGGSFRGVRAEVMRMAATVRNGREDYEHHLKFVDLETSQQERIVRYVFEKQRLDAQTRGETVPAS